MGKPTTKIFARDHSDHEEEAEPSSKSAKSGGRGRNSTIERDSAQELEGAQEGSIAIAALTRPQQGRRKKPVGVVGGQSKPSHTELTTDRGDHLGEDVSVGRGVTGKKARLQAPKGVEGQEQNSRGPKVGARGGRPTNTVGTDEGRHGNSVIPSVALVPYAGVSGVESGSRAGSAEDQQGGAVDTLSDDSISHASNGNNDGTYDINDDTYDTITATTRTDPTPSTASPTPITWVHK
jgi:hypothetical protein